MITGPKINRDGLVFGFDASDINRFYKGEPTENLMEGVISYYSAVNSYSTFASHHNCQKLAENQIDPETGIEYSTYQGTADDINAQPFSSLSHRAQADVNTTVSVSMKLRGQGTCHLTVYDNDLSYRIGDTIQLTPSWEVHSFTATWGNYTNNTHWAGIRGLLNDTIVDVADVQIELKDYATPFVKGVRSATDSLFDLTKNATLDVSNTDFIEEGFKFNAGSKISLPNDLGYTTEVSVFAIFKSLGTPASGYHVILGGQALELTVPDAGQVRVGLTIDGSRNVHNYGGGLSDGKYHYIGFTFDGNNKVAYIDGKEVGSTPVSGILTNIFDNRTIGSYGSSNSYGVNGLVPILRIYNRSLSQDDVYSDYNSIKSRFGI